MRFLFKVLIKMMKDLIDTLWNVKLENESLRDEVFFDLIDTLWNVKELLGYNRINVSRFNRYIVECKDYIGGSK